jgi:hypothetical protein
MGPRPPKTDDRVTGPTEDEFWDVALEAYWRHHLGLPFLALDLPNEPAKADSDGEPGLLTAAGGWCAPFDPEYTPPRRPTVEVPPPVEVQRPPEVPRLACGCPETMLDTGRHQPDCLVVGAAWAAAPLLAPGD